MGSPSPGLLQLRDQMRSARPGQSFRIEYIRPVATTRRWRAAEQSGLQLRTAVVQATAMLSLTPWAVAQNFAFFIVPLCCLLMGLYVIMAKPFSLQAWCVLWCWRFGLCLLCGDSHAVGAVSSRPILESPDSGLLPMAVLLFGVTFPDRSSLDRRAPWLKWALLLPLLALIPYDFLVTVAYFYDFGLFPRLAAGFLLQARVGNAISLLCTVNFITALLVRYRGSI